MTKETTWHIHIPVAVLLRYGDKRLMEMVTHSDGAAAARQDLRQMLADGQAYLTVGKCDNQLPDGSCAGHPSKEQ